MLDKGKPAIYWRIFMEEGYGIFPARRRRQNTLERLNVGRFRREADPSRRGGLGMTKERCEEWARCIVPLRGQRESTIPTGARQTHGGRKNGSKDPPLHRPEREMAT